MKRAHSRAPLVPPPFEDSSFYELVKKINKDCYSTTEDILNYYKSKDNVLTIPSLGSTVVSSLVDDLLTQIPIRSQDLENSRFRQSIFDLTLSVGVLENEQVKNISVINNKNLIIEDLAQASLDLEQSKYEDFSEIRKKNDIIEDYYHQVEALEEENFELSDKLDNLKCSHRRAVERYGDDIELVNQEYEKKLDMLKNDYQLLVVKNEDLLANFDIMKLDYQNKLEYAEMAGISSTTALEETILDKDTKIQSLGHENKQLLDKIRTCRKKISELEREVIKLSNRLKSCSPQSICPPVQPISSIRSVSSNPSCSQPGTSSLSPVLSQVCKGLVEPTLQNHGVLLKNFKVDYKNGRILGHDDIKVPLKTDDICIECGKGMAYDVTEAKRFNRGVISDLNGVIHNCGYIHTSCRNLIKYVHLKLTKVTKNEQ